jgi:phosphoglycolate phosphatase
MKYKHVIWDWNGTLFNDLHYCAEIMSKMREKRGFPAFSVNDYLANFTFPVRKYYEVIWENLTDEFFEELSIEFISYYEQDKLDNKLNANAHFVLSEIKKMGISQSILSAYSQNSLDEIVRHFHLENCFENVVGLDNIYAASKLENGKSLIQKLGFKKGETLFVGDTLHDLEVATEIGADCVLLTSGHQARNVLEKSNSKLIDELADLLTYLSKIA